MQRLSTVHPDLQSIAHELIKHMDVTVLCGHRGEREQEAAFVAGNSKLRYPRSKHNKLPSEAVDLAPYDKTVSGGVNWQDIARFNEMCDLVEAIAKDLGIKLRLGRDFSFKDYVHFELSDKHKKGKK